LSSRFEPVKGASFAEEKDFPQRLTSGKGAGDRRSPLRVNPWQADKRAMGKNPFPGISQAFTFRLLSVILHTCPKVKRKHR